MRLLPIALTTLLCLGCGQKPPAPIAASSAAVAPAAATAPPQPTAVADYLATLAAVEKSTAAVSLEGLFNKAEAAQNALMEVTGEQAVLERYSDAQFAALQAEVRGLKISRGFDIYAQPEPGFFLTLAQRHGQPADVALFTQYAATWGPDSVPRYLKLRPQPTPCVRFGEGQIAPLYAAWKQYAAQHPGAYVSLVQQNIRDLEEAVALGTCACNGLESVRSEQADFLKQFPDTPQAAAIRARREQLVKAPDVLPVNCR